MHKNLRAILSTLAAIICTSNLVAHNEYEIPAHQSVCRTLVGFETDLSNKIGNRSFVVHEWLGFSGAGYADIETLKAHLKHQATQAINKAKDGVAVFLLGGTTDGFGIGYSVLKALREKGNDFIVAGLVSSDAIKFHREGKEKGWGDVISPDQDCLLLLDTYKAEGQAENWQLITEPDGPSATVQVLVDLAEKENAQSVTMELFEGGQQAMKEALEFLVTKKEKASLALHVGYEPKKVEKAKGYRAATNIAQFLQHMIKNREGKHHSFPDTTVYYTSYPASNSVMIFNHLAESHTALIRKPAYEKKHAASEWYENHLEKEKQQPAAAYTSLIAPASLSILAIALHRTVHAGALLKAVGGALLAKLGIEYAVRTERQQNTLLSVLLRRVQALDRYYPRNIQYGTLVAALLYFMGQQNFDSRTS